MPRRTLAAFVVALVVVVLCAAAQAGRELRLVGTVALSAVGGASTGNVRLESVVGRRGRESARIELDAGDLDVSRTAAGSLPEFRLVLVPPTGPAVDLGPLRVSARGAGRLRRRGGAAVLGTRSLREFEGGTVEVRRSGATVLSASVPRLAAFDAGTSVTTRRTFGDFLAVDTPRRSPGAFLVESVVDRAGVHADRLYLQSSELDTLPGATGVRPDYRAFIVDRAGRTVSLGALRREKMRGASLRLNQAKAALPGGIATFEEFDGGRLEVRLTSGAVVLRGYLAPFRRLPDAPAEARTVVARGSEELSAPEAGSARAVVHARVTVGESHRAESFTLHAVGLVPDAGPFDVTAVAPSGTRTPLGSFAASAPNGVGGLSVADSRGRALPGGADWLSGQALEVRDASGALVLTGGFPTLRP